MEEEINDWENDTSSSSEKYEEEDDFYDNNSSLTCYMEKQIYPHLSRVLKRMCKMAIIRNAVNRPRQIFDGVDYIAETLWNLNPLHPERHDKWKPAYFIYRNNKFMTQNLRPIYPRHYELSEIDAAVVIQTFFRTYLTKKKFSEIKLVKEKH